MRYTGKRQLGTTDDSITTEVVATAQWSVDNVLSLAVDYPSIAGADGVISAAIEAMVDAAIEAIDYPGVNHVVTRPIGPQCAADQRKRDAEAEQEALF